ncbi:hypothetical protein EV126DRAFT_57219 [Verticillium dahliae]|nr:hypothetical protein EV126DRAFT_57219 [Verticillium dahliae]
MQRPPSFPGTRFQCRRCSGGIGGADGTPTPPVHDDLSLGRMGLFSDLDDMSPMADGLAGRHLERGWVGAQPPLMRIIERVNTDSFGIKNSRYHIHIRDRPPSSSKGQGQRKACMCSEGRAVIGLCQGGTISPQPPLSPNPGDKAVNQSINQRLPRPFRRNQLTTPSLLTSPRKPWIASVSPYPTPREHVRSPFSISILRWDKILLRPSIRPWTT